MKLRNVVKALGDLMGVAEPEPWARRADFDLRASPRGGGGVDGKPYVDEDRVTNSARNRFVILVHGFNVTREEALNSYRAMEENLALGPAASRIVNDFAILSLAWPGDPRLSWPLFDRFPFSKYPAALKHVPKIAKQIAKCLQDCVTRRSPTREFVLVAHSLGCRLVLETVKEWVSQHGPPSARVDVILMAAAVPVETLHDNGKFDAVVHFAEQRIAVHSRNDKTLFRWFDTGQLWETGLNRPVEPVGLYGNPYTAWTERKPLHSHDHSDYWASKPVAEVIAKALRVRLAMELRGEDLEARPDIPDRQIT